MGKTMKQFTREDALDLMWSAKTAWPMQKKPELGYPVFFQAELMRSVEMHCWNRKHPAEGNTKTHTAHAGSKVIVTAYSRFGDVGIRDRDIDNPRHGYDARVDPEILDNWALMEKGPSQEEEEPVRSNLIAIDPPEENTDG